MWDNLILQLTRHRDLLVFSIYVATCAAGVLLYLGHVNPLFKAHIVENTAGAFVVALIAAALGGLAAIDYDRPADGVFASFMTWLFFGILCGVLAILWTIVSHSGTSRDVLVSSLAGATLLPVFVLVGSAVPAVAIYVIYRVAKFIVRKTIASG
jgi:hypothetical protein